MNATLWYPIFSNIVLPINSVINPLLYDTLLGATLFRSFKSSYSTASTAILTIRIRPTVVQEQEAAGPEKGEQIEMENICAKS